MGYSAYQAHERAKNFPMQKIKSAIRMIHHRIIGQATCGRFQLTVNVEDLRTEVSCLEDVSYIYNYLLDEGYSIDDNCTEWIIRW